MRTIPAMRPNHFAEVTRATVEPLASGTGQYRPFDIPPDAGTLLQRIPLGALLKAGYNRQMAFLTYVPVFVLFVVSCCMLSSVIRLEWRWRLIFTNDRVRPLLIMVLASAALPQFFFFRPDISHLSQFMPGYVVLACIMMNRAWTLNSTPCAIRHSNGDSIPWKKNIFPCVLTMFLVMHLSVYVWFGLNHERTGSIAVRSGRTLVFEANSGIRVFVNEYSLAVLSELKARTLKYCGDDGHVIVFPYGAGINFMTGRRTFMKWLYCDDSFLIRRPGWQDETIEKLRRKRPAVVIINERSMNSTEISRFSNWAVNLKRFILDHYVLEGEEIGGWQLYVRSDILSTPRQPRVERPR